MVNELSHITTILTYLKDPAIVAVCVALYFVLREMRKEVATQNEQMRAMKEEINKENEKIWEHIDKVSERIDKWKDK